MKFSCKFQNQSDRSRCCYKYHIQIDLSNKHKKIDIKDKNPEPEHSRIHRKIVSDIGKGNLTWPRTCKGKILIATSKTTILVEIICCCRGLMKSMETNCAFGLNYQGIYLTLVGHSYQPPDYWTANSRSHKQVINISSLTFPPSSFSLFANFILTIFRFVQLMWLFYSYKFVRKEDNSAI